VHCVEEGKTGVERPEEELEETNFVASTTMATTLIESSGNSVEEMEQASVTTTSNSPLLHRASSFLSSSYKLASKGYQLAKSATEAVMDAARRTSDTASAIREVLIHLMGKDGKASPEERSSVIDGFSSILSEFWEYLPPHVSRTHFIYWLLRVSHR